MAKKVVTFGELMLKLSPLGYGRLVQAHQFNVEYAGAEANVAVSLANFGVPVSFVSAVPANAIGDAALNTLRQFGVEVSHVVREGERLGIYFAEKGASQRPSTVIYDRRHSAIATLSPDAIDWDALFEDAQWFHFTGITPALGPNVADLCLAACQAAKARGLQVSCDLNYRAKLWSRGEACGTMGRLCRYVDLCIANEADASDVFGISAEHSDVDSGVLDQQAYVSVAQQLQQRFGFRWVAITLRESISASDNNWSAMLYDGSQAYTSRKYSIHLVDRIGGGDSFGAGLIYGLLHDYDLQHALEFAVAASCLKQTIEGDFNHVGVAEVENLLKSKGTGRIQR